MDIKARWSRLRRTPIGLDVGSRLIKAVQLAPAPGTASGMRVAAAVVVPRAALLPAEVGPPGAPANATANANANASTPGSGGKPFAGAAALPTVRELAGLPEVLDRAGFSGRRVVLAAPAGGLMTSVLEIPARAGGAPARQIARMELARANRCPPDSFEMGYWDLPASGSGVTAGSGRPHARAASVMAVGFPHTQANALLDAFEAAGLYVSAIDVGACALARACEPLIKGTPLAAAATVAAAGAAARTVSAAPGAAAIEEKAESLAPPPSKMMAILDLGWETAMLWLVYGGSIIYGRPLADGGVGRLHESLVTRHGLEPDVADYLLTEVGLSDKHHADAAAAADADEDREHAAAACPRPDRSDRLPLSDHDARAILVAYADELVRELAVSFAYAAHEYADGEVGRLLMVGGGSAMPGLAGRLTDALGVPATPVAPAELAGCDPDLLIACGSPALTAAAGLALFPEAR